MRIAAVAAVTVLVACAGAAPTPEPEKKGDGAGGAVVKAEDAGAAAPACIATGTTCVVSSVSDKLGGCCAGSLCVSDVKAPALLVCAQQCNGHTQCASGCCTMLVDGSASVCAPASYCAAPPPVVTCGTGGALCASDADCCSTASCATDADNVRRCADHCVAASGCKSACCAKLNSGVFVCSAPVFCGH